MVLPLGALETCYIEFLWCACGKWFKKGEMRLRISGECCRYEAFTVPRNTQDS